ncbi:MAG: hypothetical protein V1645_04415 [archaeon]
MGGEIMSVRVYFSKSAFKKISYEVSRWYYIGMEAENKPFESVGFPLSFIALDCDKCPADVISLQDISYLVITHVAIPDDEIKNYSPANANFRKKGVDLEKASEDFIRYKVNPIISRYPLLEIASRLHSHPFTHHARHSAGDMCTIMKDEINIRQKAYNVSFSFIMTPLSSDPLRWKISCFSVDVWGDEEEHDVIIVRGDHPAVVSAFGQPYYKGGWGKFWEEEFERYSSKVFVKWSKQRRSRGWTSYWLMKPGEEIILFIPPFFPGDDPVVWFSNNGQKWERINPLFCKRWLDYLMGLGGFYG